MVYYWLKLKKQWLYFYHLICWYSTLPQGISNSPCQYISKRSAASLHTHSQFNFTSTRGNLGGDEVYDSAVSSLSPSSILYRTLFLSYLLWDCSRSHCLWCLRGCFLQWSIHTRYQRLIERSGRSTSEDVIYIDPNGFSHSDCVLPVWGINLLLFIHATTHSVVRTGLPQLRIVWMSIHNFPFISSIPFTLSGNGPPTTIWVATSILVALVAPLQFNIFFHHGSRISPIPIKNIRRPCDHHNTVYCLFNGGNSL